MSTSVQNESTTTLSTHGTEKIENREDSPEHDQEGDQKEGDNDLDSVEEFVWNLMGRTGLMSELKSRIAFFIQENGGMVPGVSVIPSRADPVILQHIFEYLQWIGMKNTSSLLLSESPVRIQKTNLEEGEQPALCGLFGNVNRGAKTPMSRGPSSSNETPFMNKTFTSKFTSSPLLSPTRRDGSFFTPKRDKIEDMIHPEGEVFIDNESNVNSLKIDDISMKSECVDDSPEKTSVEIIGSVAASTGAETPSENDESNGEPEPSESEEPKKNQYEEDSMSYNMDSFQVDDNPTTGAEDRSGNNKSNGEHELSGQPKKSQDEDESISELMDDVQIDEAQNRSGPSKLNGEPELVEQLKNNLDEKSQDKSISDLMDDLHIDDNSSSGVGAKLGSQNSKSNGKPEPEPEPSDQPKKTQDEDDSISDLIDSVIMDDNTLDISIDSNSRGLSSCEHVINLK